MRRFFGGGGVGLLRYWTALLCVGCLLLAPQLSSSAQPAEHILSAEDELNLSCLLESYPEIVVVTAENDGLFLVLDTGERVFYGPLVQDAVPLWGLSTDVRTSMRQPYPLDPFRPATPMGVAPGRFRSYALLHALYGKTKQQVQRNLQTVRALGQKWTFSRSCAQAFLQAAEVLESYVQKDPSLRPWLRSNGTFTWRRIAGEDVLSVHSFGIAFDIGVARGATYWRWSKQMPHPLQQTFEPLLVQAFEEAGFIWGGKWHEYDLMHFEYRPELICKAKKRLLAPAPQDEGLRQDGAESSRLEYHR